jgi:O-antigen ligase/polysaccharide polymerase Wzy-like membrane protein
MIAWLIAGVNLALLTATGIGSPAPTAIGVWELILAASLGVTIFLIVAGMLTGHSRVARPAQIVPLFLVAALALPVLVSVIMGVIQGVPLAAAVRSALPYAAFLPVALLGLLVGPAPRLGLITGPLLLAGGVHAAYLVGLFLLRVPEPTNLRSVFLARITFLDARTTLPLILGASMLALGGITRSRRWGMRLAWAIPLALAIGGVVSTQTRSQLLALVAGAAAFGLFFATWRSHRGGERRLASYTRGLLWGVLGLAMVVVILLAIPHTRALLQAVVLRSQASADTGRISDEWLPAVNTLLDQGIPGLLGGIGAGQSFITASGEERTYIHNLLLHALVYFGAPGLCLLLLAYAVLIAGLYRRGVQIGDTRYFALAALLVALLVYAQFFAVHKLFSFNLMVMLATQALVQPPGPAAQRG